MTIAVPERIRERFMEEILKMYSEGEVSAGRAAEMLGIPRAAFYELLAEKRVPLPEKLNQSLLEELEKLKSEKARMMRPTRHH
jgi:predicted HTH domain antitoxin